MLKDKIESLYGLEVIKKIFTLESMIRLMDALGNPQHSYKVIHVSGTNGKGSTCAFMASILKEAGYSVGLYTSPHLFTFNERIRIGGIMLSDGELEKSFDIVKSAADSIGLSPTFFEFTTAVAFVTFSLKKVDVAVIEVGMGGDLDATNVVKPITSIITHVALDHQNVLGNSVLEIAKHKAGIIKPNSVFVTFEQDLSVQQLLKDACLQKSVEYVQVQNEISASSVKQDLSGLQFKTDGIVSFDISMAMLGYHQIENALTAIVAIKKTRQLTVTDDQIVKGIARASWNGRLQIISKEPLIIVDGAHNEDGISALAGFCSGLAKKSVFLCGLSEHRSPEILQKLCDMFDHVIVTQASFKSQDANFVASQLKHASLTVEKNVDIALSRALSLCDGAIVVGGSLYLVPDVMTAFEKRK